MKNFNPPGKSLMRVLVFAFIFACTFFSVSAQEKVVGGIDVDIKDYPWQVAVDYGCGGSIIGDSWVLTAAHCVQGGVNFIYAGNSAPYASGGETYSVINVIEHPNYGSPTGISNDYALVEIEGEFNFANPNIGKIDLINPADVAAGSEAGGVMATITGWGTLSSGGPMASTLQMVEAPIVENNVACGSASDENGNSGDYSCSELNESMICAGDLIDGGEDACQGDSGGPLVVRSLVDNRWVLIGATSWGYGCADVNYPGVWSRVSYVLDWITSNADVTSQICADETACNYTFDATGEAEVNNALCIYEIDECGDCGGDGPTPGYDCDGNCLTGETLIISMSDSYGDGWNGSNLVVNGVSVTLNSGSSGEEVLCFDSTEDCNEVTVNEGSWPSEVSWTISDSDGNILLSGGAPYSGGFGSADCGPAILGCTDTEALNYNVAATEDDGSCEYPIDCEGLSNVMIEMNDSWGDGWNGNILSINGQSITLETGSEGTATACVDLTADCVQVSCDGGSYQSEVSWTISDSDGNILLSGGAPYSGAFGSADCGPAVPGCTDTEALNYNAAATEDDGSCEYPIDCEGLTAILIEVGGGAYDNEISWELNGLEGTVGSTEYCLDSGCYTFNMYDSWGDGWNGASVSITTENGESLISGTLEAGSSGTLLFSYNEDCGYVSGCMDPAASNYNSEAILDDGSCEYPVFGCADESAINYNADATDDDGSCYYDSDVLGCNDELALNFDPLVTYNDGTCEYPFSCEEGYVLDCDGSGECHPSYWIGDGYADCEDQNWGADLSCYDNDGGDCGDVVVDSLGCTDPSASNYNPNAFVDDGSCVYDVESGCTDMEALNYNPNAIEDDGSCEYPIDCEGLTTVIIDMSDSYGDGWNGNVLTINGQSFTFESGYEASATACYNSDNGDCAYVSCDGGSWQSEVSWTISDIDGNILLSGGAPFEGAFGGDDCGSIYGCTDPSALNYNELATADDGSCDYDIIIDYGACTDPNAINYDPNATFDDGSCEYDSSCNALEAVVTISTVSFAYEMEWSIEDAAGNQIAGEGGLYDNNAVYEIAVCLEDGADYNFNMTDSYGDGWNGGTFSVSVDCGELAAGGLENGYAGQVSFTASCEGGSDDAPWDVIITGSNHTIVVDGDAIIDLDGMPIEVGDALGVFFTDDNGDLQCAGYVTWTGSTNSIAAQGDDSTTDEIDGFVSGSEFVWIVWDASEGIELMASANYSDNMPNQGSFVVNGISALSGLATVPPISEQLISMPEGWSLFSTYMLAPDMDMQNMLSPIVDDVVIAKNNEGLAYLPEWGFNGVGDLQVGQGYQIKLIAANEITVVGQYMLPEDNPIELTAGWNMIGYLRTEGADAAAILESVNASGNLIIAKDYNGNAYLPEFNFNGIGNMEPGQGYQLKINNDDVLEYLSNDESYRLSSIEVTENNVSHFSKVVPTDNNMTVVIEDASWDVLPTEGSEVAAFDKAGNLIGSAIYSSPVTVLTVWGDDVMTSEKEGSLVSESVSFKVFTSGDVRDFTVTEWAEGSSTYLVDAINVASSIEINTVVADADSSDRVLVKVINVLGQEVELNDESFKGEVLFNVYDDGSVEQFVK